MNVQNLAVSLKSKYLCKINDSLKFRRKTVSYLILDNSE